jgi:seryl-tRNA synthetase
MTDLERELEREYYNKLCSRTSGELAKEIIKLNRESTEIKAANVNRAHKNNELHDEINRLKHINANQAENITTLTEQIKMLEEEIKQLNDRHQDDCNIIDSLNVTIDVLAGRLAEQIKGGTAG